MKTFLLLFVCLPLAAQTWGITPQPGEPYRIGGSGGGGASATYQLTDFSFTRTNGTQLTGLAGCGPSTICNIGNGPVYTFTTGATITVASGTGTIYVYVDNAGVLTAGHNITASCSGCTAVGGITAFPNDSVPLYRWTVTAGTLDATSPLFDKRAFISGTPLIPGTGINITGSPRTISADLTVVAQALNFSTPGASHTFSGQSDIFVCTTTCTITVPVPVTGTHPQYCAMNGTGVSTVITLAAIGSGVSYENTARTASGTAGTGTMVSGGSVKDMICILGQDSTHYLTTTSNGPWTAN
jgi:hypothetical protein